MFVGFIAVVVILLVIVGLMSSGATSGSGGVDQTKATKALGELSGLVQSAGFYKTTTTSSDYAGISTANLVSNGIVARTDTYTVADATDAANFVGETEVVANDVLVKSKAVEGLYYQVVQAVDTPSAMKVNIVVDKTAITANGTLANALESSYDKLGATSADINPNEATDALKLSEADGDSTNNVLNTTDGDGAATLYFR